MDINVKPGSGIFSESATTDNNSRLTRVCSMPIAEDKLYVLINGCIRNDRKSQESIYKLFYGKMMAVCLRYTRDQDQAKDILQDGFIKVFRNIEKFNFEGSFEGWIRRIVVNTAIDFFRKSKSANMLMNQNKSLDNLGIDISEEEEEGEDKLAALELEIADVVNAMQRLSPAYRTVFNLYVFEDYTHKEIADMLGINIGTSKSNLAKAKANLKRILEKELKNRHEE